MNVISELNLIVIKELFFYFYNHYLAKWLVFKVQIIGRTRDSYNSQCNLLPNHYKTVSPHGLSVIANTVTAATSYIQPG